MRLALSFTLLLALSATKAFAQNEVRPYFLKDDPEGICAPMFASDDVGTPKMRDDLAASFSARLAAARTSSRGARQGAASGRASATQPTGDQMLAAVADCATRIGQDVSHAVSHRPTTTDKTKLAEETALRRRELVALHLSVKNLKQWSKKLDDRSLVARNGTRTIDDIENSLHAELEHEGLRQQVWAALVAGVAFPRQTDSPETSVALPTSGLEFQTMHWGGRLDIGLGARIGVMPVTVMKKDVTPAEPGAPTADDKPFSVQQTALVMSARVGANLSIATSQELSVYYEPGLSALVKANTVSTEDKGTDHRVDAFFVPVENGEERLSESKEFGVEWSLFKDAMVNVHEFKTFTTPQVRVGVAMKTDRRFTGIGGFTEPERRTVYRIVVDDIPVFDRRVAGDVKPAAFKIGISLEYERAGWFKRAKGAAIPAGMRLVMQGNLGLLQLLGK